MKRKSYGLISAAVTSIKCYLKVGFNEIGRRHQSYLYENKFYDVVYMEILKENFKL